jgi:hypothetical protein
MKKISTAVVKAAKDFSQQKLTIGLDLGDRSSWYCALDEAGEVLLEQRLATTPRAMKDVFGNMPRCRIAPETGMHSPWVSRGTRRDRGACVQRAFDRGESKEGRPAGCADPGAFGADRSAAAVSGEASQRESASRSDRDPSARRASAIADGADQYGAGTD